MFVYGPNPKSLQQLIDVRIMGSGNINIKKMTLSQGKYLLILMGLGATIKRKVLLQSLQKKKKIVINYI